VLVPRAKRPLRFTVAGVADLVATDNGDATSLVAFPSAERPAFNGLALALLRPRAGQPGDFTLTVETEGLPPATLTLHAE
jgi:beta-galactosidase